MRPAKIQISLRLRAVRSESPVGLFWIAKDAKFLQADNEDFVQPLLGVHTCIRKYVLSRCGSADVYVICCRVAPDELFNSLHAG